MSQIIVIEGRNSVIDALRSDKDVRSIMIGAESRKDDKLNEIYDLASKKGVRVEEVGPKQLRRAAGTDRPQNVIAEVEIDDVDLEEILEEDEPLILVINTLDYERNLGAILRTAWGAGVSAVLVAERGVSTITPVVSKVAMGAAIHVPVISGSLFPMLKQIQAVGLPIVGVEAGIGTVYTEQNLRGGMALVFGGEDSGLSEPLKKYCDCFVYIPLISALSSLNVSVAVGIVLFEKLRQDR